MSAPTHHLYCRKQPYPPIRTVASTSPSDSLSTAFAPRLTKLFWGSSRSQTRLRVRNLSPVPNFTVTCGTGILEINETQFSETVLKSNRPVLVEFVATWCGPCRLISPAIEWVAQKNYLGQMPKFHHALSENGGSLLMRSS
ncbi:Thioredoxin [Quillaja saponaria]|uniref:Thioredoxin n=1 Tax=Quillaja saponaria TaxID=32244 RepID=A0AAD7KPS3_QUISA|nr:Thioredoxin [Quillaja saponaria]